MRFLVLLLAAVPVAGQTISGLNCTATAVPALVRLEGLAERVGDINLNCVGGTPNGVIRGDFRVISFHGNITNKVNAAAGTLDAIVTVNTGAGEVSTGASAQVAGANQFIFSGMNFNLGPSGTATFRITNVRIAPPRTAEQPLQMGLATNGPSAIRVDNNLLTVGIATRGLLASYSSAFVCTLSGLPSDLTFPGFVSAGIRFASIRYTEGFAEAFIKRLAPADHGTRIVARFSNFPPGARLFVPDALAGSTATIPTAAGDLGGTVSGGRWNATATGQLLLARVKNTDTNGGGGLVGTPPAGDLTAVSEVALADGAGMAIFEVLDANAASRESVQLPVFLVLEQRPNGGAVTANVGASFGPISSDATASANPVPRYLVLNPPPDCQAVGDCNSGIFPKLTVETEGLLYNPFIGQAAQARYIRIRNDAGGLLVWTASIQYKTGSGWLALETSSGVGNATIRLDASATGLVAGAYEAVLTVDAGAIAGAVSLPIRMDAREFGPVPSLPPEVSSVTHAANFVPMALAPGTIATLFGSRLKGETVEVRLNDLPARIFFANDTQINFEVPAVLPASGTVSLYVSVDGRNSLAKPVTLVAASPGIFPSAVLNEDSSVNGPANPARGGSVIQLFLTGLPAQGGATTVRIHDYTVTPRYAGAAPGFIGLQQVNAEVPPTLQSITSEVGVCWGAICSQGRPITILQ